MARVGALVCAGVLGGLAYVDISDVNSRIAGLDSNVVVGSIGAGLMVVALAAVLCVVGVFLPGGPEAVAGPTAQQVPPGYECGFCHKPLSPAWNGKCEHCKTTYAEVPPVLRAT